MIIQLNPPIPVRTPKGKALAHFMIDDGIEHDIKWVCFQDDTGECWTYRNQFIRADKNITQGREYISPFYNPDDVAFPKREFVVPATGIYNFDETTNLDEENDDDFLEEKSCESSSNSNSLHNLEDLAQPNSPPLTDLQKQVKEAKRMSETMPNFEQFTKINTPLSQDDEMHKKIREAAAQLRGNEIKVLDDFCKAYYAAESHMTGKGLLSIIGNVRLNIQQFFKDGQMGTRYWFSQKDDKNG